MSDSRAPFGVIPALVTPLDRDGRLIESGLREVIDHVIAGGVHGVFVLGTTGEPFGLTADQKRRVVEIAVEHTDGRVPVWAGASEITTRACLETARLVGAVEGLAGLSVLTPYFLTPDQAGLVEHYTAIAAATELPVVLYGNDPKTRVSIDPDTCVRLSEVPNIVGIKDSSGDMTKMGEYLRSVPGDFSVLAGRDSLIYAGLCHGAAGAIASSGNLVPELVAGIYDAYVDGDRDLALERQFALYPVRAMLDAANLASVVKAGLRLRGIDAGYALAPAGDLDDRLLARLRETLERADVAVGSVAGR